MFCLIRAFNLSKFAIGQLYTTFLRQPYNQKSQGLRSGDLGGQAVEQWRLISRFLKWLFSSYMTRFAMRGGVPSCMKMVLAIHARSWSIGMTWLHKRLSYRLPFTVQDHWTNLLDKNGPSVHDVVNTHHTLTIGECISINAVANGFSFDHIQQFCALTY